MARFWTCQGCGSRNPRLKKKCPTDGCQRTRPAIKLPQHRAVLDVPYEAWVERFGEKCGICGRDPSSERRLDRDHDHGTGEMRGLLCHRCNRALPNHITADWLDRAAEYLRSS